ncbi:AraC family transcriptional regulator [Alkanindiges illinoisensis]|uniref:AraC family transcriptional regulator n=1 Tax=Alkanindiges illinoisensis TaxID=197183 RepID=A0A4Y7XC36_9GAMM|nr:helix-turn-helix transcriptional regulator [Alkanindiges illinoisensis]TEU26898.1 AraC family transcriptional regulator [Alkanindiges illinoisensis]
MSYNRQPPIHVDCIIHQYAQNAVIEAHCVPWGELNFALYGVINLHAENTNYISPPQYAIWLPPNTAHSAHSQANTCYITLVIAQEYCAVLPTGIKLIEISPILLSIVHEFIRRDIRRPETPADQRLAQVLIDQIQQARCYDHYLPWSYHAKLEPVLQQIQQQPASLVTLQQCAELAGLSERHLLRLSQQELGMSLNEWRSRAKLLLAIDLLDKQHSIKSIACYLGYQSSSAFIGMFQRMTGKSPSQLRRHY